MAAAVVEVAGSQSSSSPTTSGLGDKNEFENLQVPAEIVASASKGAAPTSLHDQSLEKTGMDAPPSPLPTATPKAVASLRKGTPGMRSTSNKENVEPVEMPIGSPTPAVTLTPRSLNTYDALEQAVVQAATPPGPSRQPSTNTLPAGIPDVAPVDPEPVKAEEAAATTNPIEAMDALDEAVEKVSAELPEVQPSPAKPKQQQQQSVKQPKEPAKVFKKAAPIVRTTKATQARLSMAHPDKSNPAKPVNRARPSTAGLGRAGSTRQTLSASVPSRSETGTSHRPRSQTTANHSTTTTATTAEPRQKTKTETVIPHSKPRPISLSFPTPPPPPKSKKAPTTSSFRLPGEAVAAKLKAAREERATKEVEEDGKRPAFKARPVPVGLKKAPAVRQTSASRARMSVVGGEGKVGEGHKRAGSVATGITTTKPRGLSTSATSSTAAGTKPEQLPQLEVRKRPSTALATTPVTNTAPRALSSGKGTGSSTGTSTAKGKEVFNRTAAAKAAADREKKGKEEAARKARLEAAERGRVKSREWAEKRKMKKLGAGMGEEEKEKVVGSVRAESIEGVKDEVDGVVGEAGA